MTVEAFNQLENEEKKQLLLQCCGSTGWVEKMLQLPASTNFTQLLGHAEEQWYRCNEEDWKEAFRHHPKIGDIHSLRKKFSSDRFAGREQAGITDAGEPVLQALAEANELYEKRFGYIFIVCATGKSANEMLDILHSRLDNKPVEEIKIAMAEQNKITMIRLKKLFEA
jgi:2-oxo-4-hydroxy-4-carboxy-5-ureidoimidazoline decarboxylase